MFGGGPAIEPKQSEPSRELLSFEYPPFADERSDLIG